MRQFIVCLTLSILLMCGCITQNTYNTEKPDDTLYYSLTNYGAGAIKNSEELSKYQDFLKKYPHSIHAESIKGAIDEYKEKSTLRGRAQQVDFHRYTMSELSNWLDMNPGHKDVPKIKLMYDDAFWALAQNKDEMDYYEYYIEHSKTGTHVQEAKKKIEEIRIKLRKKFESLPAHDIKGNLENYKKLVEWYPDNQSYKNKLAIYSAKFEQDEIETSQYKIKKDF